jgi:hypothetical protein
MPARIAILVNRFLRMPELYDLCALNRDRALGLSGMHELALYRGEKGTGKPDRRDYLLPDLGQVKLVGKPGRRQIIFAALAGNNGVPHNHNDIGSFIVYRGGRFVLADPGAPVYTRKTFSRQRYEIVFCNSFGHSVPVIDGRLQAFGAEYRGTIRAENLNGRGTKVAVIDMTHAYPRGTVRQLVRRFVFDSDANRLVLEDRFVFGAKPAAVEEAFVTFEKATLVAGGKRVRIGPPGQGLVLSCPGQPGRFQVKRLKEASKEGRTGAVLSRIGFVPSARAREMVLRFEME